MPKQGDFAGEWLPIESAPMDFTRIIGWWRWGQEPDDWCMVFCWYGDDGWDDGCSGYGCRPAPTHWMPLPEPPK